MNKLIYLFKNEKYLKMTTESYIYKDKHIMVIFHNFFSLQSIGSKNAPKAQIPN